MMKGIEPEAAMYATAFEIWSNDFSRFAGIVKTSPASQSVICSRRSTPISAARGCVAGKGAGG